MPPTTLTLTYNPLLTTTRDRTLDKANKDLIDAVSAAKSKGYFARKRKKDKRMRLGLDPETAG